MSEIRFPRKPGLTVDINLSLQILRRQFPQTVWDVQMSFLRSVLAPMTQEPKDIHGKVCRPQLELI